MRVSRLLWLALIVCLIPLPVFSAVNLSKSPTSGGVSSLLKGGIGLLVLNKVVDIAGGAIGDWIAGKISGTDAQIDALNKNLEELNKKLQECQNSTPTPIPTPTPVPPVEDRCKSQLDALNACNAKKSADPFEGWHCFGDTYGMMCDHYDNVKVPMSQISAEHVALTCDSQQKAYDDCRNQQFCDNGSPAPNNDKNQCEIQPPDNNNNNSNCDDLKRQIEDLLRQRDQLLDQLNNLNNLKNQNNDTNSSSNKNKDDADFSDGGSNSGGDADRPKNPNEDLPDYQTPDSPDINIGDGSCTNQNLCCEAEITQLEKLRAENARDRALADRAEYYMTKFKARNLSYEAGYNLGITIANQNFCDNHSCDSLYCDIHSSDKDCLVRQDLTFKELSDYGEFKQSSCNCTAIRFDTGFYGVTEINIHCDIFNAIKPKLDLVIPFLLAFAFTLIVLSA